MQRVQFNELCLGVPIPFDVFDTEGTLLLRKGYIVSYQGSLDRLLAEGVFRTDMTGAPPSTKAPMEEPPVPTVELMFHTRHRLGRVFGGILAVGKVAGFPERLRDMAGAIQKAAAQNHYAALAGAYLDVEASYILQSHIQSALITEILGKSAGFNSEERLSMICAALSKDIGMIEIHEQLDRKSELSDVHRIVIKNHTIAGYNKCEELGVVDGLWLDSVLLHHERLDGSGYPRKLNGDQLAGATRILAIADCFGAMVRPRPYRKALVGKDALRELFLLKEQFSTDLIQLLIKTIGVFPPGSLVRLANGETAVVVRSTEDRSHPLICSFINTSGMPMVEPQSRNSTQAKYAIQSMEPLEKYRVHIHGLLKLWL